ncbi:MAG: Inosine-uridine preferring nucleoside hydrolase [uncultured Rubrobacteraceae bacterium]|uniref:Inosine-uridine preferring nucleoside hydrolase n=1 Tax=uncultured Rubrobacteraceae bacterium TaxID=349277 RepID=A0A6J4PBM8_9ACTN|nr:MAG: Inosine-uridine preferring nucleoside hydrolase [uncultured Rubrobacteraceae bacterium]
MALVVHVDTDIGGDPDDLCALAMLLGWAGVELAGVTTSTDEDGVRAGMASYALGLSGRGAVPVAAGTAGSLGGLRVRPGFPDLSLHWPEPIHPEPSPPGAALDLLAKNATAGATIVCIGPWTNLALLETARPGLLASTRVVVMCGYVRPPRPGLGQWTPEMDYNVQQDTVAARVVWERCAPVLVPLTAGLEARLRAAHLARLEGGGDLSRLVARQGELQGVEEGMGRTGRKHPGLPDDLLNFHYDPLACAVAVGWDGARVEERRLRAREKDGVLTFPEEPGGRKTRVVTDVDGPRFEEDWLQAVAST